MLAACSAATAEARELKPSAAFLGVALASEVAANEAGPISPEAIGSEMVGAARRSFAKLLVPAQARSALRENFELASRCIDSVCLSELAETLGVDRVITAQIARGEAGLLLRVAIFIRYQRTVEVMEVPVLGKGGFRSRAAAAYGPAFKKASAGLARLRIKTNVSKADVVLGSWQLGKGSKEVLVPAGNYRLEIGGGFYATEVREVALAPGEVVEVDAFLVVKPSDDAELASLERPDPPRQKPPVEGKAPTPEPPMDAPVVERPPPPPPRPKPAIAEPAIPPGPLLPPSFTRPGVFVALGGGVLAGVGIAFGQRAVAAERQAADVDGDQILNITRQQALAARRDAAAANLLVGLGLAAISGGVAWLLLVPQNEGSAPGGGTGR
ncbi:MAG: PEGA domain-containing protein [Myxococcales bacterium]|nr:PEGA domain-containing protein [Myxococcales bacterium]